MEDHIARARGTTAPFEYVTFSARTSETKKSRLHRLLAARSLIASEPVPLERIPPVTLRENEMEFPLSSLFSPGDIKKFKEWISLKEVTISYTPAISVYDPFAPVLLSIMDYRRYENHEVRSVNANNNMSQDVIQSLDFSFNKDALPRIKFRVKATNNILMEGEAWGSIKFRLSLLQSNEPLVLETHDTIGVLRMPENAFRTLKTNPQHFDMRVEQADMPALQNMYKAGRIRDFSRSMSRQTRIAYSQSEAGSMGSREGDFEEDETLVEDAPGPSQHGLAAFVARSSRNLPPPEEDDIPDSPTLPRRFTEISPEDAGEGPSTLPARERSPSVSSIAVEEPITRQNTLSSIPSTELAAPETPSPLKSALKRNRARKSRRSEKMKSVVFED